MARNDVAGVHQVDIPLVLVPGSNELPDVGRWIHLLDGEETLVEKDGRRAAVAGDCAVACSSSTKRSIVCSC